LLDFVKARKLAYYGHDIMTKQGNGLEKRLCKKQCPVDVWGKRPRTAWINNISTWTKLTAEGSIRMTNDRDQ